MSANNEIRYLTFVKGVERYMFVYDDKSRAECLRTMGRFASDPTLAFSWYDAACLSQRVRDDGMAQLEQRECFGR